jgi:hypothetical protein
MADFVSSRVENLKKIVQKKLGKETWKIFVQKIKCQEV